MGKAKLEFRYVQSLCWFDSTSSNIFYAGSATAYGWGYTECRGIANYLQKAILPLVSNPICERTYKYFNSSIKFCAGGERADTCSGDSGGPVICKTRAGTSYLCGITSYGSDYECASFPSVYTKVDAFYPWISKYMCPPDQMKCGNGNCIPTKHICDKQNDCKDGADEVFCGDCSISEFGCRNSICVPLSSVCNGINECGDNSEEFSCDGCSLNEFRCRSGSQCVNSTSACDGVADCKDFSDEFGCDGCETNQIKCKNGNCTTFPATSTINNRSFFKCQTLKVSYEIIFISS